MAQLSALELLFHELADLPPEARRVRLEEIARTDPPLHRELMALLGADEVEETAAFSVALSRKTSSGSPGVEARVSIPAWIGRYRILEVLGEGGMGTVFTAEQDDPRRVVALKLLRPGSTSASLLARFRREANLLGRLSHPGIAQVYEAGTATVSGMQVPYFAMELIRGQPLSEYARAHRPGLRRKLELIATVCDAVQHAHDNGVVHRDLKPANILVDEAGRPKVLDFGVAHVTDADVRTLTVQTHVGQLIGTIPYMSPEQVHGDPRQVDPRSDVYSLGVILYELLAGRLPYDVANRTIPEAALVIQHDEPTRLSSINTACRGDIDTMVAKALEKDPQRRYSSAGALAADIRRYLQDEPITARPASALYQVRKFARRNRMLVLGVVGTVAALLLGLVGTLWFAVTATRERAVAVRNEAAARRASYRHSIAAAASALREHDVARARAALDAAPAEYRGWEWRHLRGRQDQADAVVTLGAHTPWGLTFRDEWTLVGPSVSPGAWLVWNLRDLADVHEESNAVALSAWFRPARHRDDWARTWPAGEFITLPAADGTLQTLSRSRWGARATLPLFGPVLSGDGARLAWTCYSEAHGHELALVDLREEGGKAYWAQLTDGGTVLAFSPDGTRLVSAEQGNQTILWNAQDLTPIASLIGHADRTSAVAFSHDGARIATGSWDNTIRTWDADTGEALSVGAGHTNYVEAVRWSPDDQVIASSGVDTTVHLWNAATLAPMVVLHGHEAPVLSLAFSPDGGRVVTSSLDGTARLWNVRQSGPRGVLRGHTSYVYPVAFNADGTRLASGSWDGTIRIWEPRTGQQIATISPGGGHIYQVAFDPSSARVACTADDHTLRVCDIATGKLIATRPGHTSFYDPIAYDSAGRVVWFEREHGAKRWDPTTGHTMDAPFSALADTQSAIVSPDRTLAILPGQRVEVVDLVRGDVLYDAHAQPGITPRGHLGLAFSPDSRAIAGVRADHSVVVFEARTARVLGLLSGHTAELYAVAWSPDGQRIVSAGREQSIRVWDAATGEELAELRGHMSYVWSLAWSPDGRMLASGSGDHTVRIWDSDVAD